MWRRGNYYCCCQVASFRAAFSLPSPTITFSGFPYTHTHSLPDAVHDVWDSSHPPPGKFIYVCSIRYTANHCCLRLSSQTPCAQPAPTCAICARPASQLHATALTTRSQRDVRAVPNVRPASPQPSTLTSAPPTQPCPGRVVRAAMHAQSCDPVAVSALPHARLCSHTQGP